MSGHAIPKTPWTFYDGSNPQAVINRYPKDTTRSAVISQNGSIKITEIYGTVLTVPPGSYVVGTGSISEDQVLTAAQFDAAYWTVSGPPVQLPAIRCMRQVIIPAAVSLTPGTRSVAVTWPVELASDTYAVDISPGPALAVGGPYTLATTNQTKAGCSLTYTNASLIGALTAQPVDLFPRL